MKILKVVHWIASYSDESENRQSNEQNEYAKRRTQDFQNGGELVDGDA